MWCLISFVMNKKRYFLTFNTLIVIILLALNNYIFINFPILDSALYILIVFTVSIGVYFILNKSLIDDIFNIDNTLKNKIEKTMHEINTPVSTIQINNEILSANITDKKNLERLQKIDKSCINLLKLYEDMEYYIKKEIDAVKTVSFDLKKLIYYCVDKYDDLKQNITIDVNVKSTIIATDKSGFEIVINNLISNAIKHNNTISVIDIYFNENILFISDNGEGINSQNIYKIFDRYYQEDKNARGFGIGLNIVKEFCDQQKIDIKINSSQEGTIFSLNLKNLIEEDI